MKKIVFFFIFSLHYQNETDPKHWLLGSYNVCMVDDRMILVCLGIICTLYYIYIYYIIQFTCIVCIMYDVCSDVDPDTVKSVSIWPSVSESKKLAKIMRNYKKNRKINMNI